MLFNSLLLTSSLLLLKLVSAQSVINDWSLVSFKVLARESYPFAHEAAVYLKKSEQVFFVSNRLHSQIEGSLFNLRDNKLIANISSFDSSFRDIPMPNGAVIAIHSNYNNNNQLLLLICAQGNMTHEGGIFAWHPNEQISYPLIMAADGDQGLPFNSPNDLTFDEETGDLYFTDPSYGYVQGFRPAPKLPDSVYHTRCYVDYRITCLPVKRIKEISDVTVVKPNGVAILPGKRSILVSDSGYFTGNASNPIDASVPRAIYQIKINTPSSDSSSSLKFKAICQVKQGIADGIKLLQTRQGNLNFLFAGCQDGIEIFKLSIEANEDDYECKYVGLLPVNGGIANFAFGPECKQAHNYELCVSIFALNEKRLIQLEAGY